ncbi:NAD(P)(+)--arginine ADP-ribosyltransferase 2-like [Erythrolamprus reginae]|uniref:NAD(P)(+)--arginine ADP-ribosyltransferase 2-like n=1 Tax=Erythrolamprus reginae TaxID=121349 RepID=UPI00396CB491
MKIIPMVLGLIALFAGPLQVLCVVEVPLTMFNHSVDDQYIGCRHGRESQLQELKMIPLEEKYRTTWEKAKSHWERLGPAVGNFTPIYGIAIVAYTVGDQLYRDFNAATREAGKSQTSYDHYLFRDFHLLLTKALQAKRNKEKCYEVFRGIKDIHFTLSEKVVRFGQFASSSLDKKVAKGFGEDTFFSIRTCHGVPIDDFSYHTSQKEVLIPPYESFTVTRHRVENGTDIRLESRGVFSRHNCEVLNAARNSTPLPFLPWGLLFAWITLGPLGSL